MNDMKVALESTASPKSDGPLLKFDGSPVLLVLLYLKLLLAFREMERIEEVWCLLSTSLWSTHMSVIHNQEDLSLLSPY